MELQQDLENNCNNPARLPTPFSWTGFYLYYLHHQRITFIQFKSHMLDPLEDFKNFNCVFFNYKYFNIFNISIFFMFQLKPSKPRLRCHQALESLGATWPRRWAWGRARTPPSCDSWRLQPMEFMEGWNSFLGMSSTDKVTISFWGIFQNYSIFINSTAAKSL